MKKQLQISPEGAKLLRISAEDDEGTAYQIVAPVLACSFMFSLYVPSEGEPEEKIVLGFAEGHDAQNGS
jgi:hypothetical protein